MRPLTMRCSWQPAFALVWMYLTSAAASKTSPLLLSEIVGDEGCVVGVDIDRAALEVAEQRRATLVRTNVVFRAGDAGSADLGRDFDADNGNGKPRAGSQAATSLSVSDGRATNC